MLNTSDHALYNVKTWFACMNIKYLRKWTAKFKLLGDMNFNVCNPEKLNFLYLGQFVSCVTSIMF